MAALIVGLHDLSQCGCTLEGIELREEAWRAACLIRMVLRGFTHVYLPSDCSTKTGHASIAKGWNWLDHSAQKAFSTSKLEEVDAANEAGSFCTKRSIMQSNGEFVNPMHGVCEQP